MFKVNEFITLKFDQGKTMIFIKDRLFRQCKSLFIVNQESLLDITSIDEVKERSLQFYKDNINAKDLGITPKQEFWGHCSNLQAWVEHDYDTRLLHSELSFPLLRQLSHVGDLMAKEVLKFEIIKRFEECYLPTILFLLVENYLDIFLNMEERLSLLPSSYLELRYKLDAKLRNEIKKRKENGITILILKILITKYADISAKNILKIIVLECIRSENRSVFEYLDEIEVISEDLYDEFEIKDFIYNSPLFLNLIRSNPDLGDLFTSTSDKILAVKRKKLFIRLLNILNYHESKDVIANYLYDALKYYDCNDSQLI